jgi:hypothetical protein
MFSKFLFCRLICLVCLALAPAAWAQRQLQDSFWLQTKWTNAFTCPNSTYAYGIAVDFSNHCYVASGSSVVAYDLTGSLITNLSVASAYYVTFDAISNLVWTFSTTVSNQVRAYDTSFNLIRQWGASALTNVNGLAAGPDNLMYFAKDGVHVIQTFDKSGGFVQQWGQPGSAGGQFSSPTGVAFGPDGTIYVADYGNSRLQQFSPAKEYLRQYVSSGWRPKAVTVAPDGVVYAVNPGSWPAARILSPQLDYFYNLSYGPFNYGVTPYLQGAAFSVDGQLLYILTDKEVRVFRRTYRTTGLRPANAIPLPTVLSAGQRTGTSWVDIDFSVLDADNATARVAAVACLDGRQDLRAVIPLVTFTNVTDVLLPTNVATGVKYHLTWNAGADWITNYGNVKINLLAKDDRGLLDAHYITLPSNTTYGTPLTISQSAYSHPDFLGVWTWLVANANPNISLMTGSVYAVGTDYGVTNNALLAVTPTNSLTTTTTPDGRTFIFAMTSSNMLSTVFSNWCVREATTDEVNRARLGTTGKITQWTPRLQINGLPQAVNEYSFDTGPFKTNNPAWWPTNAWWTILVPRP